MGRKLVLKGTKLTDQTAPKLLSLLVKDDFNRADTVEVPGSTSVAGLPWSGSSKGSIVSNRMSLRSGGTAHDGYPLTVDAKAANVEVGVDVIDWGGYGGLNVRVSSPGNTGSGFVFARLSGNLVLRRRDVYGTSVELGTAPRTFGTTNRLMVRLKGDQITCFHNGDQIFKVTDPNWNTNTNHGLYAVNNATTGNACVYDNFTITTAP